MPQPEKYDEIEQLLVNGVHVARQRYHAREGHPNDYAVALKLLNDFMATGKLPEESSFA